MIEPYKKNAPALLATEAEADQNYDTDIIASSGQFSSADSTETDAWLIPELEEGLLVTTGNSPVSGMSPSEPDAHKPISRPGIESKTLQRCGIRHVSANESHLLCGISEPGLWIPYFRLEGSSLLVEGLPYGRLRRDATDGGRKYHQRSGSGAHAYVPVQLFEAEKEVEDLFFTEGEFKSLCLNEHGFTAIGLPGFYAYNDEDLLPELPEALAALKPKRIFFLGDSDTCLNHRFSIAAAKLAALVTPTPVLLPRLPLDGPKGIDDVAAATREGFADYVKALTEQAEPVGSASPARIALLLLEREKRSILDGKTGEFPKDKIQKRLVQMAAAFESRYPIETEKISAVACEILSIGKAVFKRAVAEELRQERDRRGDVEAPKDGGPPIYFDGDKYWRLEHDRQYHSMCRQDAILELKSGGISGAPSSSGGTSPAEEALLQIQRNNRVVYAGPVCGRPVGIHCENATRILATRGPEIIAGMDGGDAGPLIEFFSGLFGRYASDPLWATQYTVFCLWLQRARAALSNFEQHLPGQMLSFIGPPDTGKSLAQTLITILLGGRSADPSLWIQNKSPFNGDMWAAEHLLLSDANLDEKIESRKALRDKVKEIVANQLCPCHRKHKDAVQLRPIWRLTLSANDDPDSAFILPPLDSSSADKIIYLYCHLPPTPFPTDTPEKAVAFFDRLTGAASAFLHYVDSLDCPQELSGGRFGIKEFHHPEIVTLIDALNPEGDLEEILNDWISKWPADESSVTVGAAELYGKLKTHSGTFDKVSRNPGQLGHQLRRLAKTRAWSGRICKRPVHEGAARSKVNKWLITKEL